MKALVTGGTGNLGRLVVHRLQDVGYDVRVLSRHRQKSAADIEFATGDLATGEGIAAAVQGTDVIVHCAGSANGDEDKARHLVRAASRNGTRHLVNISVVGADRVPVVGRMDRAMFGYFSSQLAAERVIADSGLPWSTLRAAQFHDLILMVVQALTKLPIVLVPAGFRFQPIDAGDVADRLVKLATGRPLGLVPDVAGPRVYETAELVRTYLQFCGKRRPIMRLWVPGNAAQAIRAGANLAPEQAVGRRTWEDFLAEHTCTPQDSTSGSREGSSGTVHARAARS